MAFIYVVTLAGRDEVVLYPLVSTATSLGDVVVPVPILPSPFFLSLASWKGRRETPRTRFLWHAGKGLSLTALISRPL